MYNIANMGTQRKIEEKTKIRKEGIKQITTNCGIDVAELSPLLLVYIAHLMCACLCVKIVRLFVRRHVCLFSSFLIFVYIYDPNHPLSPI